MRGWSGIATPTSRGSTRSSCRAGFSYGDYLRAGAIARFSPAMGAVAEFAAAGGPVLGICNGFQVLCEAGLLPGALLPNDGLRFVCRQVELEVVAGDTAATHGVEAGARLSIPVKHMSGRYFAPEELVAELEADERVVFRYAPGQNPNGSVAEIAGVCNEARNVVGLMPHPEHAVDALTGSTDGLALFESLARTPQYFGGPGPGVTPPAGGEPAPAPFVVGVGRSGTTLLRLMLDAHPELTIPAETQFVPQLIEAADAGASAEGLVELIVGARTWSDFGLDERRLRERVATGDAPGAAAVLRAFYGLCAERAAKPRWGEKTPAYVRSMTAIGELLGEARFVHLIRDGRDVALSRRRRGMGDGKPMADTARLWRRRIEGARDAGEAARRALHGAALRGPRRRSRARAAPHLRADRARLRPRDARLPPALGREGRRARGPRGRGRTPGPLGRRAPGRARARRARPRTPRARRPGAVR